MSSIENFSNYLIYNNGEVYSIKRNIFIKPRFDRDGYKRVSIWNDDKKMKTLKIHQLVAIAYLDFKLDGLSNSKLVIDHIDNNKVNNYLHNLQIITRVQNTRRIKKVRKTGLKPGVYRVGNKFKSYITINKKKLDLGLFNNEEEAHNEYMIYFNKEMENCIL
jgi:hypothetical protein